MSSGKWRPFCLGLNVLTCIYVEARRCIYTSMEWVIIGLGPVTRRMCPFDDVIMAISSRYVVSTITNVPGAILRACITPLKISARSSCNLHGFIYFTISFRVSSLALGQSYDYPGAVCEVCVWITSFETKPPQNKTKREPCDISWDVLHLPRQKDTTEVQMNWGIWRTRDIAIPLPKWRYIRSSAKLHNQCINIACWHQGLATCPMMAWAMHRLLAKKSSRIKAFVVFYCSLVATNFNSSPSGLQSSGTHAIVTRTSAIAVS